MGLTRSGRAVGGPGWRAHRRRGTILAGECLTTAVSRDVFGIEDRAFPPSDCTLLDMNSTLSATCPTCKAPVGVDDVTCSRCGADVNPFPDTGRTPLILPGNPALSADLFRGKVRPVRIIVGSAVGFAALMGVVYFTTDDAPEPPAIEMVRAAQSAADTAAHIPDEPATQVASASLPAAGVVESASARSASTIAPAIPASLPPATPTASAAASIPARTPAPQTSTPVGSTRQMAMVPVLRMVPLVSESLRTGELIQLRGAVRDRATNTELPGSIEYTSTDASIATVDRRRGTVTGRKPGRVRIIADAGVAGQLALDLVVRAPAPAVPAVATRGSAPVPISQPPATTTAVPVTARPVVAQPVVTAAETQPRVTAPQVTVPTAAPAVRETPRSELLDADDVKSAVDRFVGQVRRDGGGEVPLMEFMATGAGHRVQLVGAPTTISANANVVRVTFEMRMTKFDAGGRPFTRIAPISMDVEKSRNAVSASDVTVGTLRKP